MDWQVITWTSHCSDKRNNSFISSAHRDKAIFPKTDKILARKGKFLLSLIPLQLVSINKETKQTSDGTILTALVNAVIRMG